MKFGDALSGATDRLSRFEHALAREQVKRAKAPLYRTFPATGPYRRSAYPKHLALFAAGRTHRIRAMLAGNRAGKTLAGAYEVTLHATGWYPDWWEGRRLTEPPMIWVVGDTGKTVRDIAQPYLVGSPSQPESGLIPRHLIEAEVKKPGVPDALEMIRVRHTSGRPSVILFKSYDQRRESFQGTRVDLAWLDEEPPWDVFHEIVLRTTATGERAAGMVLLTFTPLLGLTDVVERLVPSHAWETAASGLSHDGVFVILCSWDEVPHLSDAEKSELMRLIPPYLRDARTRGIPVLGSGRIYPIADEAIRVPDFAIPREWPRGFGMDAAWNQTAVVWGAYDPATDVLYVYDCYRRGQVEPPVHAEAIRRRGEWIPGRGDLAEVSRFDGRRYLDVYKSLGLTHLELAERSLESGILAVWTRLSTDRLRLFASCQELFEELRTYRRDERGQIVKKGHDLVDALRYLVRMTPHELAADPGLAPARVEEIEPPGAFSPNDWML